MYFKRTDRRGFWLWEIRTSVVAVIISFLTAVIFDGILLCIFSAVWMIAYIVMTAWYYPLKYEKLSYAMSDEILVVNGGVVYRRRKSIFLKNIQYISTLRTPLQRLCGLETLIVHAAGGVIMIPNLKVKESERLRSSLVV